MKSQAPLQQPDLKTSAQATVEAGGFLDGLKDVTLRYRLENGPNHSTWIVDCGYQTAGQLEIQAGPYTLTQFMEGVQAPTKAAERLCSLPTHPAVLRVDAVTSSPHAEHIWYEAAEAGTLADYCRARGQLPLAQVTTIAKSLTEGLSYLHRQDLAYQDLTSEQCVFTVKGELKLLAPDLDLRTLNETTKQSKKAEDIAACAAILWFCLTGKEPKAQRLRAPLVLSVPQASDALAQTLEDAIDLRANQPSLTDIAALFDFTADSAPLELHLSAHESVLSRLPAYTPAEEEAVSQPKQSRLTRAPKVYGAPRNLSNQPTKKSGLFHWKGRKIKVGLPTAVAILLGVAAVVFVFFPWIQGRINADTDPQITLDAQISEPAQHDGTVEPPQNLGAEPSTASGAGSVPSDQQQELTQELSELISLRSDVLSAGEVKRVQEYAVPGSELEKNDQTLLAQEGASGLEQMSSQLVSVEDITRGEKGAYIVTAVVEAHGYSPQASKEELAQLGMTRQGDSVRQTVSLTVQASDRGLRIESAHPVPQGQS